MPFDSNFGCRAIWKSSPRAGAAVWTAELVVRAQARLWRCVFWDFRQVTQATPALFFDGHAPHGLERRYARIMYCGCWDLKYITKYLWNEMDCNRKKPTVLWDLRELRNNYNHEKGISRLAIIKIWYNPLKELWPVTRISETTGRFQKQWHKVWTCNDFEIILVFIMLTAIIIYYYHLKFLICFADESPIFLTAKLTDKSGFSQKKSR